MGQNFTRIENVFLTDCQSQLSLLDDMLISQASSVDSIHTAATLLLSQLEGIGGIKEGGVTDSNVNIEQSLKLTKDLLRSVDGTLINQTMAVLQALSHLKRSIKGKAKDQALVTMPALKNQKIEQYINQHQEKEDGAHQDQSGSDDTALTIEKQKKEIENLKSENEIQTKKMNDDYQKLMKKTKDMEKDLSKNDKKPVQLDVVPVQLYYQQGGDQMASVVQDIMSQMNKQDKFGDRRLAFITCEEEAKIKANIPLLVFCFNKSRLGTDATHAIQGIQQLKNTALLIFHHKDEHALPSQGSDRVLTDPEFKSLGGIFDVAFLAGKGIYECELNDKAICNVVTFIQSWVENTTA